MRVKDNDRNCIDQTMHHEGMYPADTLSLAAQHHKHVYAHINVKGQTDVKL